MKEVIELVWEIESRTINSKLNELRKSIRSEIIYIVKDEIHNPLGNRTREIRTQIKNEIEKVIT